MGTEAQHPGALEVAPAQPVSPVRGHGADGEKQVRERVLRVCQEAGSGPGRLLRGWSAGFSSSSVLWEERNKAG